MRQVLNTIRTKKVFNISLAEFKKGEWLKSIPDSELIEVQFKRNFLSIHDATIKKVIVVQTQEAVKAEEDE